MSTQTNKTGRFEDVRAAIDRAAGQVVRDRHHRYFLDGRRVLGVTQVLKVLSAPQLNDWKVREGVKISAQELIGEGEDQEDYARRIVGICRRNGAMRRNAGEQVHRMVEAHLLGRDPPKASHKEFQAFMAFFDWWESRGFTVVVVEGYVASRTHEYCGGFDFLGHNSSGRLILIDFKTSYGSYLSDSYRLQIAAYRAALDEIGVRTAFGSVAFLPFGRIGPVIERETPADWQPDFDRFLDLLKVARWALKE